MDNVEGDVELPAGVKHTLSETIEKVTENHAQEATRSKFLEGLQEVEETFKKEISDYQNYCRALVYDKKKFETEVLKLKEEIQARSTEFQATRKAWELEKDELLSQIVASRKECADNSIQNQRALLQYREEKAKLECGLSDSRARCQELLLKIAEDRHLCDSEKANLQRNLESMATERGLVNQQNSDLRTKVESLNAQVNESNAAVAQLEDQLSSLAAAKMFLEKTNNSLQTEMDRTALISEEKEVNLKRKIQVLETVLVSVQNDLDSSMETTMEKDRNIDDLQYKLSEITEAKRLLEEKNKSILSDVNKRTVVLEEENELLQLKIRWLESNLRYCSTENNRHRMNRPQTLPLSPRRLVIGCT